MIYKRGALHGLDLFGLDFSTALYFHCIFHVEKVKRLEGVVELTNFWIPKS